MSNQTSISEQPQKTFHQKLSQKLIKTNSDENKTFKRIADTKELEHFKSIIFDDKELKSNIDGTKIYFDNVLVSQHTIKGGRSHNGFRALVINGKKMYTHQVVALIFVPNPNNYPFACHIDTNTLNNHYKNIAWGTRKFVYQNMRVANRIKLCERKSKLPAKDISKIIERLNNGVNARTIAKEYGTSDMSIIRLKKRHQIVTNCNKVYDDEFKENVRKHLSESKSMKITSVTFGVRPETIWKWNKVWNIEIYNPRNRISEEMRSNIIEALKNGSSIKECSYNFDVSYSFVYSVYVAIPNKQ